MKYLFFALLFSSSAFADEPANWPSFLGIGRHAPTTSKSAIPYEWNATTNIAWQFKLPGYGQSSPVVWDGQVYVTCVDGLEKNQQRVVCLELASGRHLWTVELPTTHLGKNDDYHSRAALTAVADAAGVVAAFESGDIVALDHSGKVRWKFDLVEKFGPIETNHGISSSLAQHGDLVFLWVQRKLSPYLLALNKSDGAVAWKVDRPIGTAWSSPVLVSMQDGANHIVLSCMGASAPRATEPSSDAQPTPAASSGSVCGLDPLTGGELWKIDGLSGNSSQTPVMVAPGKFLIGASAGREGGPTKEAVATNGLVSVQKQEDKYRAEYVWHSQRATSGFCSPCYHAGYAYFTDRRGVVTCMDIQDGAECFTERLEQSVWATPLGIDDKVFFVGELGTTVVLKAGQKAETVSKNVLWEGDADATAARSASSANDPTAAVSEIPKNKPRQYAIVAVDSTLIIRRGDVVYAIRAP